MAAISQSKRKRHSTSASRGKAEQLPKDLLTVADIPRKKILDLIALAKKLKAAHGKKKAIFPLKGGPVFC